MDALHPAAAAQDEQVRPEKRQRLDEASEQQQHHHHHQQQQHAGDADAAPGPPPAAELRRALGKIANHIGTSAKFSKASQLLRQVMDAVDREHRDDFFAAIKAAFAHPEHCSDPLLRKDYQRLMKAVALRADVFSKRQQAQLEVYSVWALLQAELFTDDSFAFNKVAARIKAAIAALPDADEEQEAAWAALHPEQAAALAAAPRRAAPASSSPSAAAAAAGRGGPGAPQPAAVAAAAAAPDEADPFGLDAFIAQAEAKAQAAAAPAEDPAPGGSSGAPDGSSAPHAGAPGAEAAGAAAAAGAGADAAISGAGAAAAAGGAAGASAPPAAPAPAAKPPGLVWDAATCLVMHKQALLDCLATAKAHQHKLAWARTSVELLIEEAAKPAAQGGLSGRFVGGQRQALAGLMAFVNGERAARRSGVSRRPGGKGTGDYQTSFERARAEWGSASWVSARGKVGGQGDAKVTSWLG